MIVNFERRDHCVPRRSKASLSVLKRKTNKPLKKGSGRLRTPRDGAGVAFEKMVTVRSRNKNALSALKKTYLR